MQAGVFGWEGNKGQKNAEVVIATSVWCVPGLHVQIVFTRL